MSFMESSGSYYNICWEVRHCRICYVLCNNILPTGIMQLAIQLILYYTLNRGIPIIIVIIPCLLASEAQNINKFMDSIHHFSQFSVYMQILI